MKVLSVGNSFSVDAQEYLYQILEGMGVEKIKLGNLYIGGCDLSTHLMNAEYNRDNYTYYTNTEGVWDKTENCRMDEIIESEDWDYITFQQASGSSGIAYTYDDLELLIDVVKPLCPKTKLVWHMTWAYQGDAEHSDYVNYDNDQEKMYQAIVEVVGEKIETNDAIDFVIPTGTAVQNARTSYIGDHLTRDGYHLSKDLGRYIAGLTFAHALTGISVDNVEYRPQTVSEGQKKIAIESVENCFKKPYEVTESKYDEEK